MHRHHTASTRDAFLESGLEVLATLTSDHENGIVSSWVHTHRSSKPARFRKTRFRLACSLNTLDLQRARRTKLYSTNGIHTPCEQRDNSAACGFCRLRGANTQDHPRFVDLGSWYCIRSTAQGFAIRPIIEELLPRAEGIDFEVLHHYIAGPTVTALTRPTRQHLFLDLPLFP